MNYEEAKEHLKFCGSYERIPALLEIFVFMDSPDWLRLLGEEWTCCDNIGMHLEELVEAINFHAPYGTIPEMMTAEEQDALNALPKEMTIYRGCFEVNKWGLSWSRNRKTAMEFPTLNRYKREGEQPLLVTAKVKKRNVIALKLGRDEAEIITYMPKHIRTVSINANP